MIMVSITSIFSKHIRLKYNMLKRYHMLCQNGAFLTQNRTNAPYPYTTRARAGQHTVGARKMEGQPLKRKILTHLEKLIGPEYIADHIVGGGSISGKAKELGYDRGIFLRVLTKTPEYKRAIDEIREVATEKHAETGQTLMRELRSERKQEHANAEPGDRVGEISMVDVSIAREQAMQHRVVCEGLVAYPERQQV